MLTSITPLGERARNQSWLRAVGAFTSAAVAAGATVGSALGLVGSALPGRASLLVTAMALVAAALLDAVGVPVPGPRRQVDETWIGEFRDWVYGLAFGAQLGAGAVTYVVTWGTWAVALAVMATGSAATGAGIGAAFGAGRGISLWASAIVDSPDRLLRLGQRMTALARPARAVTSIGLAFAGIGLLTWGGAP